MPASSQCWLCWQPLVAAALLITTGWAIGDPEYVSLHPPMLRIREMLDTEESISVQKLLLDAVIYFNDTNAYGQTRAGAETLPPGSPRRPRYRMQSDQQLSLFFDRPPEVLQALYDRISSHLRVHPNNIEAIYHVYGPAQTPSNLHLDNFNRYLYPHRFASISVFFDDSEDGGTVFPLLIPHGNIGRSSAMPVARESEEVSNWHSLLNTSRLQHAFTDLEAYAHRRVDASEPGVFRRRVLEAALEMCRGGRELQKPVVPERGTLYMWKNFLGNGEDDVRTLHAGCGSSHGFKLIGTFFIRDGAGPFQEQSSFWDPLEELALPFFP